MAEDPAGADELVTRAIEMRERIGASTREYRQVVRDVYEALGATAAARRLGITRSAVYQLVHAARKERSS